MAFLMRTARSIEAEKNPTNGFLSVDPLYALESRVQILQMPFVILQMPPELRLDLGQRRCICDLLLDRYMLGGRCCLALLAPISLANRRLQ
jgi:hypothetical protein